MPFTSNNSPVFFIRELPFTLVLRKTLHFLLFVKPTSKRFFTAITPALADKRKNSLINKRLSSQRLDNIPSSE